MSAIPGLILHAATGRAVLQMANNPDYLRTMFAVETLYHPQAVTDFHSGLREAITTVDGKLNLPVSYTWPEQSIQTVPYIVVTTRSLLDKDELASIGDMRGLFEIEAPDEPSVPGGDKTYPERANDGVKVIATVDKIGHTSVGTFEIACCGRSSIQAEMLAAALRGFLFRAKFKLGMEYGLKDMTFDIGSTTFASSLLPSHARIQTLTVRALVEHYYNPYSLREDEDEEFWESVVPTPGSFITNFTSITNEVDRSEFVCDTIPVHRISEE